MLCSYFRPHSCLLLCVFFFLFLQKVPSAAARLARLPVVRTACGKLWLLYADAKRSHPNLRTVCEALEESVAALGTVASVGVSPVLVQLEPHSEFRPPGMRV